MNDTLKDYLKSLDGDLWDEVENLDDLLQGIDHDIDHDIDHE